MGRGASLLVNYSMGRGVVCPPCGSVAVADVPLTPATVDALVLKLANVDGFEALPAGVAFPAIGHVVAVAGFPDGVGFLEGHGSFPLVDLFSIEHGEGSCEPPLCH